MAAGQGEAPVIVWFRDDLRLADNPALHAAAATGRPLICLFIEDRLSPGLRLPGSAARWWLHGALAALDDGLAARGGQLHILNGLSIDVLERAVSESGARAVYWNRRYDEAGRTLDAAIKTALKQKGVEAHSFNGALLHEPWTVTTRSGGPFRVFTPYWRAACQTEPAPPLPVPDAMRFASLPLPSLPLAALKLEPRHPDWAGGLRAAWQRDEAGARACLDRFLAERLDGYADLRDRPDRDASSALSPYLRFGNISVRQVWHALQGADDRDAEKFRAELGWREFSYHLLFHNRPLQQHNLQRAFDAMPWRSDPAALAAWQRGRTGYPLVDAGMRQLWATGWMHNRVRMVAASFLVKHLLIDWRVGEEWFWDTLVDADPASNPASWQWVAGTGADAAPYFRIMNPVIQGEKFDPDGAYVRRWVPELQGMPTRWLHKPWTAPATVRAEVKYAGPIVDHAVARERALAGWRGMRGGE